MEIVVRLDSTRTLPGYINSALDWIATWVGEAIENEIRIHAHEFARARTAGELAQYYDDGRMPYYSGDLLNSLRVESTPDGSKVSMLWYAGEIEEGNLRVEILGEEGDRLSDWFAFQRGRRANRLGDQVTVGAPHPFVEPAILHVLEYQLRDIARDAFTIFKSRGATG